MTCRTNTFMDLSVLQLRIVRKMLGSYHPIMKRFSNILRIQNSLIFMIVILHLKSINNQAPIQNQHQFIMSVIENMSETCSGAIIRFKRFCNILRIHNQLFKLNTNMHYMTQMQRTYLISSIT